MKKLLLLGIIFTLVISGWQNVNAEEIEKDSTVVADTAASGTCGENLTWNFDGTTLTISGNGKMTDYEYSFSDETGTTPWNQYCDEIEKIVIEKGVTGIGEFAFTKCTNLNSISIPDGVTSIGKDALHGCSNLKSVTIPDSVTSIGTSAFNQCASLKSIKLPEKLTKIENYTFELCSGLTDIVIPKGVESVGNWAFHACSSLTSIIIPENVTTLGYLAFYDCSSLENVIISEGMETIYYGAFSGCNNLTNITLPGSLSTIGEGAFLNCKQIKRVDYTGTINQWCSINFVGDILSSNPVTRSHNLYINGELLSNAVLENGITRIRSGVLRGCSSLTSVVIPDSVENIETDAFDNCAGLTNVIIPEGVISIGEKAFYRCKSLKNIIIPGSVTDIGYQAIGYYYDSTDKNYHIYEDFVIHGDKGSMAEKYAYENGIKFEVLNVDGIKSFVERLYTYVLGRTGDLSGVEDWTNQLLSGLHDSISASYGFVFSDEFKNRNLSNEQKVDVLYITFLNRISDESGRKIWVDALNSGVDFEKVFQGFVMSDEFAKICESYGLAQGDIGLIPGMTDVLSRYRNQNVFLTCFVARCYTKALQRGWDTDGIETWCKLILTNEWTPRNVAANGFIHSDEFINKNTNNEEYVSILYQTFLGRELDEQGATMWIGLLDGSEWTRDQVLDGFADSDEFNTILGSFGLN